VGAIRFAPDGRTVFSLDLGPIAMEWDLTTLKNRNAIFYGPLGAVKEPAC
jgi:hypothetical protein